MVWGCDPIPYIKHNFKISANHHRFPYYILKKKDTFKKIKHNKSNNVKTILILIILVGSFKIKQNKCL